MPAVLHISDLHRTSGPRLHNDELLAAISSDSNRWESEGIPRPDLVIVSGDLIQGVPAEAEDSDAKLTSQYAEAADLLDRIATEFAEGDRSRVVVVPGNHDVNWSRALRAMEPLEAPPIDVRQKFLGPDSQVRWNWAELRAYGIIDNDLYEQRYDHFRVFRSEFYDGIEPSPLKYRDVDLVSAEYPSLGLVVVGFASWFGNDCFCTVGDIHPSALAQSQKIVSESSLPIAIAVWHHSIVGGPRVNDYMDQRTVHKLVDFGFTVGLHGHQHYAGAAPFELSLPNLTSMVVIGAGSLAVGDEELPAGERRQFNLVVIDPDEGSVTVHVRAMSSGGVFTGSHRDDFGGNTSVSLRLPRAPNRLEEPTVAKLLDDAMSAAKEGRFEDALKYLPDTVRNSQSHARRQVEIVAFAGLKRNDKLIELLNPPQSVDEVFMAISLYLQESKFDEASNYLDGATPLLDHRTHCDLAGRIAAERTIR